MNEMIKKLIEKRNTETAVKTDYTALYKLLFGDRIDSGLNADAELEEKIYRALAELDPLARYCLEEKYLRGRTAEQLAGDFRGSLDMNEFAGEYLEEMFRSLRKMFLEKTSEIFRKMRENNFNELKHLDEQGGFVPLPDSYYEEGAFKSPADVLRIAIDKYEKDGKRFEDAYTDAESDELRDLYNEEMDGIFDGIKDNDFYETNFQNMILDFPPEPDIHLEPAAFRSIAELLRDCIEEFYNSFYGNSQIFDGYTMLGETEEGIAKWLSGSFEVFADELCERAVKAFRRAASDEGLEVPQ